MLLMGDEYGRTQQGNNNGYNQDSALSWMRWDWSARQTAQFEFCRALIAFRQETALIRRRYFFTDAQLLWIRPDGQTMSDIDWQNGNTRCMGVLLDGQKVTEQDESGQNTSDPMLLLIMNGYWNELDFALPGQHSDWEILIETATNRIESTDNPHDNADRPLTVAGRSLVLLRKK
jgi:isoamylase